MSRPALGTLRAHISPQTLQILLAIEEHGNFARAAEQVKLVPSAVSRRVAELESAFGTQLLRRTPHSVEFTAAGKNVLARAHSIIGEIDMLVDELAAYSEGTRGAVRFAASVFALTSGLPSQIASFRREFPKVALEFRSCSSRDVLAALLKNEIDVGVFAAPEVPPGLRAKVYDEDSLTLLVPSHHALANREYVRMADLAAYELVSTPSGTDTQQLIANQARRHGLRLRSSIEVSSLDALVQMTQAGLGIAIVPSRAWTVLGPFKGLRQLPIKETWAQRQMLVGIASSTSLATPAGRLFLRLSPP